MQMDRGRLGWFLVLGGLLVTWFLPVILPAVAPEEADGFTTRIIVMFAFMAAYTGAATWVLAPGHRRLHWGAISGLLMIVVLATVAITFQIATGTLELAPGETAFSTLIELPFWLSLVGVPCAVVSAVGWLVARWVAGMLAKRRGP